MRADTRSAESSVLRLTAIVPSYNHGHFLPRAIAALAAQVPYPDEILVIDDASTDHSPAVLAALEAKYPSLRVIKHERNLGAIASLNRGIAEARGLYIYLGAADDQALPGLFATGMDLLEKNTKAAFACAECRLVDEAGVYQGIRPPAWPASRAAYLSAAAVPRLLRRIDNWALTGTAILRRAMILAAGGLDPTLGSFADGFLLRQLALRHGFCFAARVVAIWTVRPDGLSRSTSGNPEIMREVLAAARRRFKSDPVFPLWYADLFERRLRFAAARITLQSHPLQRRMIGALAAFNASDRAVLCSALAVPGRTGRFLALAWLTLRKRPFSLIALARTALLRRLRTSRT